MVVEERDGLPAGGGDPLAHPRPLEIRAVAYDNASVLVHQTTLQLDLEKLDTYSPPMVSLWPEAHDNQFANSTGALNMPKPRRRPR